MFNRIFSSSMYVSLGNATDKLTYHNDLKFSTKDEDNDGSNANCAKNIKGAWWYGDCRTSNLNGVYQHANDEEMMVWGKIRPVKRTEMKIRPVDF